MRTHWSGLAPASFAIWRRSGDVEEVRDGRPASAGSCLSEMIFTPASRLREKASRLMLCARGAVGTRVGRRLPLHYNAREAETPNSIQTTLSRAALRSFLCLSTVCRLADGARLRPRLPLHCTCTMREGRQRPTQSQTTLSPCEVLRFFLRLSTHCRLSMLAGGRAHGASGAKGARLSFGECTRRSSVMLHTTVVNL